MRKQISNERASDLVSVMRLERQLTKRDLLILLHIRRRHPLSTVRYRKSRHSLHLPPPPPLNVEMPSVKRPAEEDAIPPIDKKPDFAEAEKRAGNQNKRRAISKLIKSHTHDTIPLTHSSLLATPTVLHSGHIIGLLTPETQLSRPSQHGESPSHPLVTSESALKVVEQVARSTFPVYEVEIGKMVRKHGHGGVRFERDEGKETVAMKVFEVVYPQGVSLTGSILRV